MTAALSSPTYALGWWSAGNTGITDPYGTTWGVGTPNGSPTAGVYDGPDVTLNQSPLPNADGALRSRSFRPQRAITISGWARGATALGMETSRLAFAGLMAGGGTATLTITFITGTVLTATVERAGAPKVSPANGLEFDWQLTLSATDPNLYGPTATYSTPLPTSTGALHWGTGLVWGSGLDWGSAISTGLVTVVNPGYQEAWPTWTITAPTDGSTLSNPYITNTGTGDQLFYADTLVLGDVVKIMTSPLNRGVLKNGVPYRINLTTAQYFSIPPQGSVTVQFGGISASTTGLLTASVNPAY